MRKSNSAYGLFDFRFRHFITPDYIRTVYFLAFLLVLAAATVVGALNVITIMDPGPNPTKATLGLLALDLFLAVLAVGFLVTVRLACEFIMVVHRSEEHLRAIKDKAT